MQIYKLEIFRNSTKKLGVLRGSFKGLGVQKGTQTACWPRPCAIFLIHLPGQAGK